MSTSIKSTESRVGLSYIASTTKNFLMNVWAYKTTSKILSYSSRSSIFIRFFSIWSDSIRRLVSVSILDLGKNAANEIRSVFFTRRFSLRSAIIQMAKIMSVVKFDALRGERSTCVLSILQNQCNLCKYELNSDLSTWTSADHAILDNDQNYDLIFWCCNSSVKIFLAM